MASLPHTYWVTRERKGKIKNIFISIVSTASKWIMVICSKMGPAHFWHQINILSKQGLSVNYEAYENFHFWKIFLMTFLTNFFLEIWRKLSCWYFEKVHAWKIFQRREWPGWAVLREATEQLEPAFQLWRWSLSMGLSLCFSLCLCLSLFLSTLKVIFFIVFSFQLCRAEEVCCSQFLECLKNLCCRLCFSNLGSTQPPLEGCRGKLNSERRKLRRKQGGRQSEIDI